MRKMLSGMLAAVFALSAISLAACSAENDDLSKNPDPTIPGNPDPQESGKESDVTIGTSIEIPTEKEREIVQAWLDKYSRGDQNASEFSLDVRGVFGDTYAFYLCGPFAASDVITDILVDNILFEFPSSYTLDVYHGGTFYTLGTAFENGLLTRSDLLALQKNYNNGWNWSTSQIIKEDYVREYGGVNTEDLSLRVFYRWSMERSVLFVDGGADYPAVMTEQEVDGVTFCYGSTQQLLYYGYHGESDSMFCDLETAFASGCLDHEDLLAIQYNYENGIQIIVP
ncbi:MAG TPA: hypothetical protein H9676_06645 [Firmicutes bacterium]|nr:hypothetical protein [Bacillota bacterium]